MKPTQFRLSLPQKHIPNYSNSGWRWVTRLLLMSLQCCLSGSLGLWKTLRVPNSLDLGEFNMGGPPKIWENPPNHPFVHRGFHYFHHPFWGTTIFGNTHICFVGCLGNQIQHCYFASWCLIGARGSKWIKNKDESLGDFAHFTFRDHRATEGNVTQIERRSDLHKLVKPLAELIDGSFRHLLICWFLYVKGECYATLR